MKPLMTIHGDTFISDMLDLCGAQNVFADRERRYPLAADLGRAAPLPPEKVEGRDVALPARDDRGGDRPRAGARPPPRRAAPLQRGRRRRVPRRSTSRPPRGARSCARTGRTCAGTARGASRGSRACARVVAGYAPAQGGGRWTLGSTIVVQCPHFVAASGIVSAHWGTARSSRRVASFGHPAHDEDDDDRQDEELDHVVDEPAVIAARYPSRLRLRHDLAGLSPRFKTGRRNRFSPEP